MDELLKREDAYKAELKKERDEVSRLKSELEKAQSRNAELEKSAAEEGQLRVEETRKLKEALEQTESRATSAQEELAGLKAQTDIWLEDLVKIKREMDSKPFAPFCCPLICQELRHWSQPAECGGSYLSKEWLARHKLHVGILGISRESRRVQRAYYPSPS